MSDTSRLEVIAGSRAPSDTIVVDAPPSKSMYYRLGGVLLSGRGCILNIPDCEDADAVNDILLAAGAVIVSDNRICLDVFREASTYDIDVRCSGGAFRVTLPALIAAVPPGARVRVRMCRRLFQRLEEGTWQLLSHFGSWSIEERGARDTLIKIVKTKTPTFIKVSSPWSSQPISGSLLAAAVLSALLDKEIMFDLSTSVSYGHVLETIEVLRHAGARINLESRSERGIYRLKGSISLAQRRHVLVVPGDWGLASLLLPAASRFRLVFRGLWKPWPGPGDHMVAYYASIVGYESNVILGDETAEWVVEPGYSVSQSVNVGNEPDLAVSLAYAAAALGSTLRITGVQHLTLKESNRLESVTESIRLCGVFSYNTLDSLIVSGSCIRRQISITCPGDHRVAMGIASLSIALNGCALISNAMCVAKSWRSFWQVLTESGLASIKWWKV